MQEKEYEEILMPFTGTIESLRFRQGTLVVFFNEYPEYFHLENVGEQFRAVSALLLSHMWDKKKIRLHIDIAGMKIRKIENVTVDILNELIPYQDPYGST